MQTCGRSASLEITCAFPSGGELKSQNSQLIPSCSSCLAQLEAVFTAVCQQVPNIPGEIPRGDGELVAQRVPSSCSLRGQQLRVGFLLSAEETAEEAKSYLGLRWLMLSLRLPTGQTPPRQPGRAGAFPALLAGS